MWSPIIILTLPGINNALAVNSNSPRIAAVSSGTPRVPARDSSSAMSPTCSHCVMMGTTQSHKKPIPRESSAPWRQHSPSSRSRPTGGRRMWHVSPARKTKPSLRLILGLAALRMFWAVFIFGFSTSSSFKAIPLKAVVLPLAPGLFPSPHQPSQKVQQLESPDPLESLPFSKLAGQPSRKNLPACWLSWDKEGTIPHALLHHQLAARLSESLFSSCQSRVSLPFFM